MKVAKSPETIGLEALAFIAADEAEIGRFLQLSGLSVNDLRRTAGTTETLVSVMEYVMGHERTAKAFAEEQGYRPDELSRALFALGGGRS